LWDLGILCDAGVKITHTMLQAFTLACLACSGWILTTQRELKQYVDQTVYQILMT
jgi:hypothetical protein